MSLITFFDLEVDPQKKKVLDIGGIRSDDASFHGSHFNEFREFIKTSDFICGHNIFAHDLKYLQQQYGPGFLSSAKAIDTLLLSPLLFPKQPYHHLLKDDKIQTDELNNPLNDAKKARDLFYDEVNGFNQLKPELKIIFFNLLSQKPEYSSFFTYLSYREFRAADELEHLIREIHKDHFCEHADIGNFILKNPIALAYSIALLNCHDRYSITPPWVLRNHPEVERLLFLLRNNPCLPGCPYCNKALNPILALKRHFGFDVFRTYDDKPLQENAVNAAVRNKSLLAIFPTGGGKSITFQVPALMSGENAKALTVVISPLQSLMKDQVDNLEKKGITEAVTINGLLDPIERSKAIERIENGFASILYISPESLRSVTIERLLLKRKIARFVIDEAHCFSSWGQDFRVDYLYIGDFIKELQKKKNLEDPIPVSCFTATAKQKVIEDIKQYFLDKLNLTLEVFSAKTSRKNLHYKVFNKENEEEKYNHLRSIIESKNCPAIVYVSRTRRAYKLAERLSKDGFQAKPYHGKMDKEEKSSNQNAFMNGEVNIMVATSAFGMGVDKSDVGSVIHYDISDSLENYVQEAGRAGRDEKINADCYVLFNEDDLDKHFILLNQTKITSKEINQVWRAIKDLTRLREKTSSSALEIARKAGWDEGIRDIETRITTAIAALEDAGYLKRGQNMPRIFANSILTKNAEEAISKINASGKFSNSQKTQAIRIIKKLFSSKSKRLSTDEQAESRVDYISDQLGMVKDEVIRIIELLRDENILAQTKDLTAFIKWSESSNRSLNILKSYSQIETHFLASLKNEESGYNLKDINEKCIELGATECNLNKLKTIINFWGIKNWVKKQNLEYSKHHINIALVLSSNNFREKLDKMHLISSIIIEYLYEKSNEVKPAEQNISEEVLIEFSIHELREKIHQKQGIFKFDATIDDIEDSLFYLSRIEALKIEGGFLVVHNKLSIDRLEKNNRIQYKETNYEKLKFHYQQKVQQIHIVGEYAKKMIRNYDEALRFVEDYFTLNNTSFLNRYFPGSRQDEIKRTLTPEKFQRLFGDLSPAQLEIIKDSENQYIVVAAGPGSGKTRVLVHKLASLLLAEDVKHEQLLMLTFSRSAATEFKKRLLELVGNAANFIEIKTFHSYCFDLLGRVGNLSQAETILKNTVEKIKTGVIEKSRITKTVLVVDEAQDISADEFELIKTLIDQNEDMRVILVGDDDQNIYGFRGADSRFMKQLITDRAAKKYELVDNYRSKKNIVDFSNKWVKFIGNRLKDFPGYAKQEDTGIIKVIEYVGSRLIIPLTTALENTGLSGSSCILTQTNEEAIQTVGLLVQMGFPAKLIQSNDGFNLANLYEIKYFSDQLGLDSPPPLISDDDWNLAATQLSQTLRKSTKLNIALNAIKQFALTNPVRKYKTDWVTFLQESKLEDFAEIDSETIFVATIHKAKGREFDNVILLLKDLNTNSDEQKRVLYVAVTRAKSTLAIHYNGTYLKKMINEDCNYSCDKTVYPDIDQVSILLNHKDVNLGYFEYVQRRINALESGSNLSILENGLGNSNNEKVIGFSKKFSDSLAEWQKKGFHIYKATVNFIVYWKDEEKNKELKIILPQLVLKKK